MAYLPVAGFAGVTVADASYKGGLSAENLYLKVSLVSNNKVEYTDDSVPLRIGMMAFGGRIAFLIFPSGEKAKLLVGVQKKVIQILPIQ